MSAWDYWARVEAMVRSLVQGTGIGNDDENRMRDLAARIVSAAEVLVDQIERLKADAGDRP